MTTPARRNDASAPWFDGLSSGVLLIHQCSRCDTYSRPDAVACPTCLADGLHWVPAAGSGSVVCVITEHHAQDQTTLGLVELDEGPWLAVRLIDSADAKPGARVELIVLTPPEGEPIPAFTLVPAP